MDANARDRTRHAVVEAGSRGRTPSKVPNTAHAPPNKAAAISGTQAIHASMLHPSGATPRALG
eukprot:5200858-Alexandrium_andersonii.AAC.1